MSMRPTIRLWEEAGLGIIIESPEGVPYSNQTGGTSCLHPEVVGYYVPLRNDRSVPGNVLMSPALDLLAYFEGPAHRGTGATSGLQKQDADFVDEVLRRHGLSTVISVDRQRLHESHEAWVRVQIHSDESQQAPVFDGFGPYPRSGVLTWPNSD